MTTIVVGVDGSDNARHALEWAIEEARTRSAKLKVVHAWHEPTYAVLGAPFSPTAAAVDPEEFRKAAVETLDAALAAVDPAGLPTAPERLVMKGSAALALLGVAADADLLVVGSRGLGGFKELLLGSVSHQLAHHSPCPLVIVPTPP